MIKTIFRSSASIVAFFVVTIGSFMAGIILNAWAASQCEPSKDTCGRAIAPPVGGDISLLICVILGAVGAWLVWLWTEKANWSVDLFIATPVFLIFSIISTANYINLDTIYTRDSQAIMNILLFASGVTVIYLLQKTIKKITSNFVSILLAGVLALCLYAFVTIPLWYTLSFLSWKMGAGELDTLDVAAKSVSAAVSLMAMFGVLWKDGRIEFRSPKGN